MPCEDVAPNYCDINVRISTDSSHSLAIRLAVLRQVIRGQLSLHTVENLSNLSFLRSQEFSNLEATVFHVWGRYVERSESGMACAIGNVC